MSGKPPSKGLQGKVLVVDDEADMVYTCTKMLEDLPITLSTASSGKEALEILARDNVDLALIDVVMPGMGGLELLREITRCAPDMEVIMLTGFPTVETAVGAVEAGALDYLTKPFSPEQLQISVQKALAIRTLKRENERLKAYMKNSAKTSLIIGDSPALQTSFNLIDRAAGDDCNVLIVGETGTGKELTAQTIHRLSERRDMPFVPVDCGALNETLLESELFGHEKGAFTGAHDRRIGILEYANGGTVFLDEISEASSKLQIVLLRFLEERQFRRVGSNQYIDTDVRTIAATNKDLADLVQRKRFRQDLYFRLNVLCISLPALRQRTGDIPLLVEAFVHQLATQRRKAISSVEPGAMAALCAYHWPGNIRELRNVIECAVMLCDSDEITLDVLSECLQFADAVPAQAQSDFRRAKAETIESFERNYLTNLLKRTEGNVRQAARIAGMRRTSMQRLLQKHKIT